MERTAERAGKMLLHGSVATKSARHPGIRRGTRRGAARKPFLRGSVGTRENEQRDRMILWDLLCSNRSRSFVERKIGRIPGDESGGLRNEASGCFGSLRNEPKRKATNRAGCETKPVASSVRVRNEPKTRRAGWSVVWAHAHELELAKRTSYNPG